MNWRGTALAALSAFIFSSLVGIVSAVSLGALLVRAVTAAAVFGAGFAGVYMLIRRFLPELLELEMGAGNPEEEEAVQRVNIVLDDDDGFEKLSHSSEEKDAGTEDSGAEDSGEPALPQGRSVDLHEDEDGNLFGSYGGGRREAAADNSGAAETSDEGIPAAPPGGDSSDVSGDDVEELEPLEDLSPADSSDGEDSSVTGLDDDEMPGLGSFDDFEGTAGLADSGSGAADLVEVNGQEQDPREMAKAIQTVLKKQKG